MPAAGLPTLSAEQIQTFHQDGFLILRQVIAADEVAALQREMGRLIAASKPDLQDHSYGKGHADGSPVLRRIEYVLDKSPACRALLGHPAALRAVEEIAGPDFFTGQDAMVLKMPGQGMVVPWHRDLASTDDYPSDPPVFVGDYYIDNADLNTCLWVIAGSHRWSDEKAREVLQTLNAGGFSREGAIPVEMRAGDVLFHNVRTLHGSPENRSSQMRRVIYYTFHTARIVAEHGPHRREYIDAKQKVLLACLRERAKTAYAKDETPFDYQPPAPFNAVLRDAAEPATYRYAREEWLRPRK
jgi:phytanoyl-CoA hydroxylase